MLTLAKTVFKPDNGEFEFGVIFGGGADVCENWASVSTAYGRAMTELLSSKLHGIPPNETLMSMWTHALTKKWVVFSLIGRREADFEHSTMAHYRKDPSGALAPCTDCRTCEAYYFFGDPLHKEWKTSSPLADIRTFIDSNEPLSYAAFKGDWPPHAAQGVGGQQGIIVVDADQKMTVN